MESLFLFPDQEIFMNQFQSKYNPKALKRLIGTWHAGRRSVPMGRMFGERRIANTNQFNIGRKGG